MIFEVDAAPGLSRTIRIAVVDQDEEERLRLAEAVGRFEGCACVGSYASGEAALKGIRGNLPDVVLMDIEMPGASAIEWVSRLKGRHPQTEILVLTACEEAGSVFKALAAGANGYLLKETCDEELRRAVQEVLAGKSPMSGHIARKVVEAFRQPPSAENETSKLSPREKEVLALLAKGFSYKEIAAHLKIGYDTVHNYIRRIYEKLGVRSRGEAVARYFRRVNRLPTVPDSL